MKRNSLFRLWYLLLPVMLLTNQLHSQSVIYSSDQRSEYSIIRNYFKNVDNTIGNSTCQILTIVLIIQKATIPISLY